MFGFGIPEIGMEYEEKTQGPGFEIKVVSENSQASEKNIVAGQTIISYSFDNEHFTPAVNKADFLGEIIKKIQLCATSSTPLYLCINPVEVKTETKQFTTGPVPYGRRTNPLRQTISDGSGFQVFRLILHTKIFLMSLPSSGFSYSMWS